jgi:hypothetical protein
VWEEAVSLVLASSPACEARGRGGALTNSRQGNLTSIQWKSMEIATQRVDFAYVPTGHLLLSLTFAGLASDLPGPKTRAPIWSNRLHGRAEDVDAKKDSRQSHTGSRTEHGAPDKAGLWAKPAK